MSERCPPLGNIQFDPAPEATNNRRLFISISFVLILTNNSRSLLLLLPGSSVGEARRKVEEWRRRERGGTEGGFL